MKQDKIGYAGSGWQEKNWVQTWGRYFMKLHIWTLIFLLSASEYLLKNSEKNHQCIPLEKTIGQQFWMLSIAPF